MTKALLKIISLRQAAGLLLVCGQPLIQQHIPLLSTPGHDGFHNFVASILNCSARQRC
jgi:hypothetical protein